MRRLKTALVDRGGVNDRGFSQLQILIRRTEVVTPLRQRKTAHAVIPGLVSIVVVARDQRVARVYGEVEARTKAGATPWLQKADSNLRDVEGRIENRGAYQFVVICLVTIDLEKE